MVTFYIQSGIAAVICLAAAVFDIRTGKIPNQLTFPAIIAGIIFSCFVSPISAVLIDCGVIIAWFFLGMTNFMGLGDIKLVMALTAWIGWKPTIFSFIFSILCLCVYAAVINPLETGIYVGNWKQRLRLRKIPVNKKSTKYKFAPFMLIGTTFYMLCCSQYSLLPINWNKFLWG